MTTPNINDPVYSVRLNHIFLFFFSICVMSKNKQKQSLYDSGQVMPVFNAYLIPKCFFLSESVHISGRLC